MSLQDFYKNKRVLITGHTDTVGSNQYNERLSMRRSNAVMGEMVRQGIPIAAITTTGKGETELLVGVRHAVAPGCSTTVYHEVTKSTKDTKRIIVQAGSFVIFVTLRLFVMYCSAYVL